MSEPIQFFFDEHLPLAAAKALNERGIETLSVTDTFRRGISDGEQLSWATERGLVMVTCDADFIRLHAEMPNHAGIVYVSGKPTIGRLVRGLILIHQLIDSAEMCGQLEFLPD